MLQPKCKEMGIPKASTRHYALFNWTQSLSLQFNTNFTKIHIQFFFLNQASYVPSWKKYDRNEKQIIIWTKKINIFNK